MALVDLLTSRRCSIVTELTSDCAENIYIQDGGYDYEYDLGGVVLTTTWWRCSCPSSVGMQ